MTLPTTAVAHDLVRLACRAPSIHNTQPWAWRVVDAHTLELHADRSRQLEQTDPEGRALAISCGAALHHLEVAARGLGLEADVRLLPSDPDGSELLARVHLTPGGQVGAAASELLEALRRRATDRRAFTERQVPVARLRQLLETVTGAGAHAVAVTDPEQASTVSTLLRQARSEQSQEPRTSGEQAAWIDHGPADGVPVRHALPHPAGGAARRGDRYGFGLARPVRRRWAAAGPGELFVLVYTVGDDLRAWLEAGRALSALWLDATRAGLTVTPETQVVEVERTRRLLGSHLLDGLGSPQVLVSVGWQDDSRPPQPPTPRRSLHDVLLP